MKVYFKLIRLQYVLIFLFSVKINATGIGENKEFSQQDKQKRDQATKIIQRAYRKRLNHVFPEPIKKNGIWEFPKYTQKDGEEFYGGRHLTRDDDDIELGDQKNITVSAKLGQQEIIVKTGQLNEINSPKLAHLLDVRQKTGVPMAIPLPLENDFDFEGEKEATMPKLKNTLQRELDFIGSRDLRKKQRLKADHKTMVDFMRSVGLEHGNEDLTKFMTNEKGKLYAIGFGNSVTVGRHYNELLDQNVLLQQKQEKRDFYNFQNFFTQENQIDAEQLAELSSDIDKQKKKTSDLEHIIAQEEAKKGVSKYKPLPITTGERLESMSLYKEKKSRVEDIIAKEEERIRIQNYEPTRTTKPFGTFKKELEQGLNKTDIFDKAEKQISPQDLVKEDESAKIIQLAYRKHLNITFPQPIKKNGVWHLPKHIKNTNGKEFYGGQRLRLMEHDIIGKGAYGHVVLGTLGEGRQKQEVAVKYTESADIEPFMLNYLLSARKRTYAPMAIPLPLEKTWVESRKFYRGIMPRFENTLESILDGDESARLEMSTPEREAIIDAMKSGYVKYGDLHNGNFMFDKKGNLHVIDFNSAEPLTNKGKGHYRQQFDLKKIQIEHALDLSDIDMQKQKEELSNLGELVNEDLQQLSAELDKEKVEKYKPPVIRKLYNLIGNYEKEISQLENSLAENASEHTLDLDQIKLSITNDGSVFSGITTDGNVITIDEPLSGSSPKKIQTKKQEAEAAVVIQRAYRNRLDHVFPEPVRKRFYYPQGGKEFKGKPIEDKSKKWHHPKYVKKEDGQEFFGGRRLTVSDEQIGDGRFSKVVLGRLGQQEVAVKIGEIPEMEPTMLNYLQSIRKHADLPMVVPMPLGEYERFGQNRGVMPKLEKTLFQSYLSGELDEQEIKSKQKSLIIDLKSKGLRAIDAHEDNFIFDKQGTLHAIDFEYYSPVGGLKEYNDFDSKRHTLSEKREEVINLKKTIDNYGFHADKENTHKLKLELDKKLSDVSTHEEQLAQSEHTLSKRLDNLLEDMRRDDGNYTKNLIFQLEVDNVVKRSAMALALKNPRDSYLVSLDLDGSIILRDADGLRIVPNRIVKGNYRISMVGHGSEMERIGSKGIVEKIKWLQNRLRIGKSTPSKIALVGCSTASGSEGAGVMPSLAEEVADKLIKQDGQHNAIVTGRTDEVEVNADGTKIMKTGSKKVAFYWDSDQGAITSLNIDPKLGQEEDILHNPLFFNKKTSIVSVEPKSSDLSVSSTQTSSNTLTYSEPSSSFRSHLYQTDYGYSASSLISSQSNSTVPLPPSDQKLYYPDRDPILADTDANTSTKPLPTQGQNRSSISEAIAHQQEQVKHIEQEQKHLNKRIKTLEHAKKKGQLGHKSQSTLTGLKAQKEQLSFVHRSTRENIEGLKELAEVRNQKQNHAILKNAYAQKIEEMEYKIAQKEQVGKKIISKERKKLTQRKQRYEELTVSEDMLSVEEQDVGNKLIANHNASFKTFLHYNENMESLESESQRNGSSVSLKKGSKGRQMIGNHMGETTSKLAMLMTPGTVGAAGPGADEDQVAGTLPSVASALGAVAVSLAIQKLVTSAIAGVGMSSLAASAPVIHYMQEMRNRESQTQHNMEIAGSQSENLNSEMNLYNFTLLQEDIQISAESHPNKDVPEDKLQDRQDHRAHYLPQGKTTAYTPAASIRTILTALDDKISFSQKYIDYLWATMSLAPVLTGDPGQSIDIGDSIGDYTDQMVKDSREKSKLLADLHKQIAPYVVTVNSYVVATNNMEF